MLDSHAFHVALPKPLPMRHGRSKWKQSGRKASRVSGTAKVVSQEVSTQNLGRRM